MLKFFYQPLFSHSFSFSNFPAILLPSVILFPSKSFLHQKAQSKRIKPKPNVKAKSKKQKPPAFLQGPFINSSKQGGAQGGV
jgi:hypothetical protein